MAWDCRGAFIEADHSFDDSSKLIRQVQETLARSVDVQSHAALRDVRAEQIAKYRQATGHDGTRRTMFISDRKPVLRGKRLYSCEIGFRRAVART